MDGQDISSRVSLEWDRVDDPGSPMMSGGRYRFRFLSGGYQTASFAVATNPWRRSLVLNVSLWPIPAELILRNESSGRVVPRLDGSGSYLDMSGTPAIRRIGHLKPGEETRLVLPPGDYGLEPGWWKHSRLDVTLSSGARLTVVMESKADGAPGMRIND
jgi:hypothetical protein